MILLAVAQLVEHFTADEEVMRSNRILPPESKTQIVRMAELGFHGDFYGFI